MRFTRKGGLMKVQKWLPLILFFVILCVVFFSLPLKNDEISSHEHESKKYEITVFIPVARNTTCNIPAIIETKNDEITKIFLPYGEIDYPDCEFNLEATNKTIFLGIGVFNDFKYIIERASEKFSEERVDSFVFSSSDYLGDKDSHYYHRRSCYWATQIEESDLIYFPSVSVAEAFSFYSCQECEPHD